MHNVKYTAVESSLHVFFFLFCFVFAHDISTQNKCNQLPLLDFLKNYIFGDSLPASFTFTSIFFFLSISKENK